MAFYRFLLFILSLFLVLESQSLFLSFHKTTKVISGSNWCCMHPSTKTFSWSIIIAYKLFSSRVNSVNLFFVFLVCLLYFVPAGLYCAYNNLGFVNLKHFDPTTYFILLQFRVVITGVVFQVSIPSSSVIKPRDLCM